MMLICVVSVFLNSGFVSGNTLYREENVKMPSTVDTSHYSTIRRTKDTESSLRIQDIRSTTNYSDIRVYGSNAEGMTTGVDCTYGTPKSLSQGGSVFLPNRVLQKGYERAGLKLKLSNTRGAHIYFRWFVDV